MWQKHGKKILIGLMFAVITVAATVLISYSSRHNFAANDQIEAYKRARTIEIYTVEDYLEFAESFTEEYNYDQWEIVLCNDLNFWGYENIPVIGETSIDEEPLIFSGTFEGNGYKISNLHISNPGGRAAMFACLGGIVKNLRVEDCSFCGDICGAIAAETYGAAVLNCYVDAETSGEIDGTIIGELWGRIINCVSLEEPVGQILYGNVDNCFLIGTENIDELNANLYYLSGAYHDADFQQWESSSAVTLSNKKRDLLETLTARLMISGKELTFNGYYSECDGHWYVTLPATYGESELYLEAKTSGGGFENFKRTAGEETVLFTWGDYQYPIRFIAADNIDTICITLEKHKDLDYVHANKVEQVPGYMTIVHSDGRVTYETVKGFYGHGNSSWESDKKSYNLKFDSYIDLLGMGTNDDFALLAGYRMNSLMSYVTNAELTKLVEFDYAPEYRLVNLYVGGEYVGVYFLTEKIEIDTNRLEITSVYNETQKVNKKALESFSYHIWVDEETMEKTCYYDIEVNPDDITGGYLLELDMTDYGPADSRFTPIGETNKVILKRAQYSSKEEVEYMAVFWQDFENALYAEDGFNIKEKHYTEYIDLESFAMQWLMYELSMEDSLASSIYYYKESDIDGDGKIHACYPWDLERSFKSMDEAEEFGSVNSRGKYWAAFYQHEDFRKELQRIWNEKFILSIEYMIADNSLNNESNIKNLKWHIENIEPINCLETSRWNTADLIGKCNLIKEILQIRKDVISATLEQ